MLTLGHDAPHNDVVGNIIIGMLSVNFITKHERNGASIEISILTCFWLNGVVKFF